MTPQKLRFSILAFLICVGCATHRLSLATPCKGLDWFEIGRRDGAIGRPASTFQEHIRDCAGGVPPDQDLYASGRNSGLVDFCTQQSGFELGRAGATYLNVCPEHLERKFLPGYQQGLRVHSQEEQTSRTRL